MKARLFGASASVVSIAEAKTFDRIYMAGLVLLVLVNLKAIKIYSSRAESRWAGVAKPGQRRQS